MKRGIPPNLPNHFGRCGDRYFQGDPSVGRELLQGPVDRLTKREKDFLVAMVSVAEISSDQVI